MSISGRWPWEGHVAENMESVRPVRPSNSGEQNLLVDVGGFGDKNCVVLDRNDINWSQIENTPALIMA